MTTNHRERLSLALLGFLRLEGQQLPEVRALQYWLDSCRDIGAVAVGMAHQSYDLRLTRYDARGGRATFYPTGMEHSITSATASACGGCRVRRGSAQASGQTRRPWTGWSWRIGDGNAGSRWVALVLAALGLMGQVGSRGRIFEGEMFVVKDPAGKMRATLGLMPDGSIGLFFLSKGEKRRGSLAHWPDGTVGLNLTDKDGRDRVVLRIAKDDVLAMGLRAKDGKERAWLGVEPDGETFLTLYDKNAAGSVNLFVKSDGSQALNLIASDGKPRAVLGMRSSGETAFNLLDKAGKVIWKAP